MENISNIDTPLEPVNEQEELLPEVQKVISQVRNDSGKGSSALGSISVLLITIFLFLGSGLINNPVVDIFIIIFVILIHETGHLIAMKIFGYKDVKMFFIPFFGAAVSGRHDDVSSSKKALISLAGPVPGIIIGFTLVMLSGFAHSELLNKAAIMFLYLNGLNLLPLFPFDGGRIMTEIFFIRNRYFEFLFKIFAVAVFIIAAITFKDFILAFIAITLLLTISNSFKLATLTIELKKNNPFNYEGSLLDQNNRILNTVVSGLIAKFPNPKGERFYVNLIYDLWERLKYIRPKISSTIGISMSYLFFLFLSVIFFFPISQSAEDFPKQDTIYFGNNSESAGVTYHKNGKVHIVSSWKDGKRDGIWSEYDEEGILISKYLFDDDKFVCKMRFTKGRPFDTLYLVHLTKDEKNFIANELQSFKNNPQFNPDAVEQDSLGR
jgi:Zn-dependent protease